MMLAAMTIDEVDPASGESFKGVDLAGINDVVDDAGKHLDALHRALRIRSSSADACPSLHPVSSRHSSSKISSAVSNISPRYGH